jgi:hypothetical protein
MTMKSILGILVILALFSTGYCQFNDTLTDWIASENVTARGRIFANIGPKGQYVTEADPGAVVAAPSTSQPNYYYQISFHIPDCLLLTYTGSVIRR